MQMEYRRVVVGALALLLNSLSAGCATYRTAEASKPDIPPVYSGTRLNLCAAQGNQLCVRKSGAQVPEYPILDLPASFVLDTLLLPGTVSRYLFEQLSE